MPGFNRGIPVQASAPMVFSAATPSGYQSAGTWMGGGASHRLPFGAEWIEGVLRKLAVPFGGSSGGQLVSSSLPRFVATLDSGLG